MTKPQSLNERLNQSQEKFSSRPFIGTKGAKGYHWASYEEIFRRAQYVKTRLDFQAGQTIALIANNSEEWVYIMLGALAAGATLVPMYASENVDSLNFILEDVGADRVICEYSGLTESLICTQKDSLDSIAEFDWSEAKEALQFESVDQSENAFILYTSGTTADPKGVPLSHENVAHTIETLSSTFPLKKEDRSLSFLPWAHSFGLIVELLTLCANGASIGIAESVQTIIPNLASVKPTILISVPRLFSQFYASVEKRALSEGAFSKRIFDDMMGKNRGLFSGIRKTIYKGKYISRVQARFGGELKYAISGGAALSPSAAKFMNAIGIQVYEGYGLTETSALISFNLPGATKIGSVGKPVCEVQISEGSEFEKGIGEICVKGKGVTKGYLNKPGVSFDEDGYFKTGDIGRMDSEGFLWILGRLKEQYKLSTGKYVAPVQLEESLEESEFVKRVFLYGENRSYNIALVELKEAYLGQEGPELESEIMTSFEQLGDNFRRFEFPKKIVTIDTIEKHPQLLTQSGKIKRAKLFEFYQNEIEALYRE